MRTKNKNTSFATDMDTFAVAKVLAALEGVSLSTLVEQALRAKMRTLLPRHEHNPSVQDLAVKAGLRSTHELNCLAADKAFAKSPAATTAA